MPNLYFQFKKFIVYQDKCAMKVCTDSCLFGAWASDVLYKRKTAVRSILDIGAGTGLLSLLVAQKLCKASIDAIEAEEMSARQANENFSGSPWKDRLHIYNCRIQDFIPDKEYECIISNPPFYENDLLSQNHEKNQAHHNTGLTLQKLLQSIKRMLSNDGIFFVLLPFRRTKEFQKIAAESGFFSNEQVLVKQTEKHPPFRSLTMFSGKNILFEPTEIIIKNNRDQYTSSFTHLLKDYYLHL